MSSTSRGHFLAGFHHLRLRKALVAQLGEQPHQVEALLPTLLARPVADSRMPSPLVGREGAYLTVAV